MQETENQYFHDSLGRLLSLEGVVEAMLEFMQAVPDRRYKIIIGTDSQPGQETDFVSAIVIHRERNGGRYWWRRFRAPSFRVMRDRIYQEAILSLKVAQALLEILKTKKHLDLDLEIHLDVGFGGETRSMIQEVVGMVRGSGFEVRTKPESFGATKVADRHV
ncbi:MAG: ribonuclease H-like YkuK family protein [Candidatus Paceibacteria bacterium]